MWLTFLLFTLVSTSTTLAVHTINVEDFLTEDLEGAIATESLLEFDIDGFLEKYGYPFESTRVITEDGYILGLHRIPYGRTEFMNTYKGGIIKPVVLLMHGLGSSSVDYFILGPEKSLALMLADQGYDVWLGNNRGNTWSRKHETLDPDKNATFWDFSFHELGMYDIPALIDHILEETGVQNISYVGHSQGTTQFFVTASIRPEYNDKINLMVALGPAAYSGNLTNPLVQIIKNYQTTLKLIADIFNLHEILPHSSSLSTAAKLVCAESGKYHEFCSALFFVVFGFDSDQLNRTSLSTFLDNFPAGNSIKEMYHFLQGVKSGQFRQYDYGVIKNLEIYNHTSPPDYKVSLITAPVALYYGQNDWLVSPKDVDRLTDELPNLAEKHLIDYKYFNHIDFILAKDVASILYYDVIKLLNGYNGLDPFTSTGATDVTFISSTPDSQSTTPSSGHPLYSVTNIVSTSIGLFIVNLLI